MANEDDKTVVWAGPPTVDEINTILSKPIKDPLVGTKLGGGRYEILDVLGEGGMSVVYKAKQELVDRLVAIKTLKLTLLQDPMLIKRFDREVKTLSKLNHPNIVTVYDCIVGDNGQPYFVMDYLQGYSLQELLTTEGRISSFRARNIFVQVCNAVEHAHRNGIVHRDLKPANIMLTDISGQEFVKVVDFGLAKLGEDAQRLTQTGELWGSPLYMSPEQCSGYNMDARSDIYSLGAVMFEALTGHVPFRGTSFLDTISKQVGGATPPFAEVEPTLSIPSEIEHVVMRALAKDPDQRYQTMAELKNVIERDFPSQEDRAVQESNAAKMPAQRQADTFTSKMVRETAASHAASKHIVSEPSKVSPKAVAPAQAKVAGDSSSINMFAAALIAGLIAAGVVYAAVKFDPHAVIKPPATQTTPPAPAAQPTTLPVQTTVAPIAPPIQPVQTPETPLTPHTPVSPPVQTNTGAAIAPNTVANPALLPTTASVKKPAKAAIKAAALKPVRKPKKKGHKPASANQPVDEDHLWWEMNK